MRPLWGRPEPRASRHSQTAAARANGCSVLQAPHDSHTSKCGDGGGKHGQTAHRASSRSRSVSTLAAFTVTTSISVEVNDAAATPLEKAARTMRPSGPTVKPAAGRRHTHGKGGGAHDKKD